jgi:hypothetical protein
VPRQGCAAPGRIPRGPPLTRSAPQNTHSKFKRGFAVNPQSFPTSYAPRAGFVIPSKNEPGARGKVAIGRLMRSQPTQRVDHRGHGDRHEQNGGAQARSGTAAINARGMTRDKPHTAKRAPGLSALDAAFARSAACAQRWRRAFLCTFVSPIGSASRYRTTNGTTDGQPTGQPATVCRGIVLWFRRWRHGSCNHVRWCRQTLPQCSR